MNFSDCQEGDNKEIQTQTRLPLHTNDTTLLLLLLGHKKDNLFFRKISGKNLSLVSKQNT